MAKYYTKVKNITFNGKKIKIAFSNNDEIAENKLKDTINKIYK